MMCPVFSSGFRLPPSCATRALCCLWLLGIGACATAGAGQAGNDEKPSPAEAQAMAEVGGKAKGLIVWSSSRLGNHDLFVINSDGTNVHAISKKKKR